MTATLSDQTRSQEKNEDNVPLKFETQRHISYFKRCLQLLPNAYATADTNRMTLAYFVLSGLDLLGALDDAVDSETRQKYIHSIYALQVLPSKKDTPGDEAKKDYRCCGFRGSAAFGQKYDPAGQPSTDAYDRANIAMTYTALTSLLILGDDLSGVDRSAVIGALKHLQQEDGSFSPVYESDESDLRFLYCACVISYLLNDWSGVNRDRAKEYVRKCIVFDYGLSQAPGDESHGGATYCGVAALFMLDGISQVLPAQQTILWLLRRQGSGFSGRVSKPEDTCYSFWVGGALDILSAFDSVDQSANQRFLCSTQTKYGGFGKWAGTPPDVLHSYMGVAGFALMRHPDVLELDAVLNVSRRTADFMKRSCVWWIGKTTDDDDEK